jgi:DNA-binding response OmpR family regulator
MSAMLLLADREPFLERYLRAGGFELVGGGARPDLVLAGDEADLERWRGEAPVIVLGPEEADALERVRAFRGGCDDYLTRPFHYDELVERIRAVLRRAHPPEPEALVVGRIRIELATRVVSVDGEPLALSQKEYALLLTLARDPRRVFTRTELLRDIWGYSTAVRTRTLDSHVARLRRKLRAVDPLTPYIDNEWGVGYRLLVVHG